MNSKSLWFTLLLSLLGGCYHQRGHATLLAPGHHGGYVYLGDDAVVGEGCGMGQRESRAFDDALSKRPGAELLVGVEISDLGACARVIGRPARFAAGSAEPAGVFSAEVGPGGARPPSGQALVYIYRSDVGRSRRSMWFRIQGQSIELADNSVTSRSFAPGTYAGEAEHAGKKQPFSGLVFEADHVYFIKLADLTVVQPNTNFGLIGIAAGLNYHREEFSVVMRDPAYARVELQAFSGHAQPVSSPTPATTPQSVATGSLPKP